MVSNIGAGYEVRNIEQIDNKNVRIGKTFKYGGDYHLTNLYYVTDGNVKILDKEKQTARQDAVDEKTKLIIQTPLMFIPNSIIYFNEKHFLELSFNNEDNDKDVLAFRKWFQQLEEYAYILIKKRTSLKITKECMISSIKVGHSSGISTKLLVPININVSKCILNDGINKILFNWEIPVPTYGIAIIWVKNIWVKKEKWGINLFMYATRVMNSHILDPIDFLGIETNNKSIRGIDVLNKFHKDDKMSILVGQVPEYAMYFKMLKLGIPRDAVRQKMTLLGIDSRVIDYSETIPYSSVLHYISNPHIAHSSKSQSEQQKTSIDLGISSPILISNISRTGLLSSINAGGFKLKKVDNNDKILVNTNSSRLKVPSLLDIQGALAKLKKVDLDYSA